jgi:hypothetical protein
LESAASPHSYCRVTMPVLSAILPTSLRVRIADLRGRGVYAGYPNRQRCIFIHIPKTGGTSVARSLFGEASRHLTYVEYQRANPEKFRRFIKFSFVRNPWDRLVSTFFFLKGGGLNEIDRAWAQETLARFDGFDDFVRVWLNPMTAASWVHFRPQSDFILDSGGNVMVDFVGRYERLSEDYALVASRLGKGPHLPLVNRSAHDQYAAYYTLDTREIVASVYARDVAAFGYAFDSATAR